MTEKYAPELHPLYFAVKWNQAWREAFDHTETPAVSAGFGVVQLVAYLDANLAYAAQQDELPFADFAREASACRNHLERVLHDGEQVETGAPCLKCKRPVEKITERDGRLIYRCQRCREDLSEAGYTMAVRAEHIERADMLTVDDMAIRTGVLAPTIRRWANVRRIDGVEHLPLFRSCGTNGRKVKIYRVAEVERVRDSGGDTRGSQASAANGDTVSNDGAA